LREKKSIPRIELHGTIARPLKTLNCVRSRLGARSARGATDAREAILCSCNC